MSYDLLDIWVDFEPTRLDGCLIEMLDSCMQELGFRCKLLDTDSETELLVEVISRRSGKEVESHDVSRAELLEKIASEYPLLVITMSYRITFAVDDDCDLLEEEAEQTWGIQLVVDPSSVSSSSIRILTEIQPFLDSYSEFELTSIKKLREMCKALCEKLTVTSLVASKDREDEEGEFVPIKWFELSSVSNQTLQFFDPALPRECL